MEKDSLVHFGIKGMRWGVRRYQNKDGSLTPAGKVRYSDDYKRAHSGKDIREMSDNELRNANNRLQMERQYADLTRKTSRGKRVVNKLIKTAGTLTAIEGAYKTYKRFGDSVVKSIGNMIVSDLKKSGW